MSSVPFRPPLPTLAGALVLEYAILDGRVTYSGHSNLFVDGNEIGPVARIAIGQKVNETQVLLFHCDTDWVVLGVAEYPSLEEAKIRAERVYSGLSKCWVRAVDVEFEATENDADPVDQHCVFCGKGPAQVNSLVEKNGKFICDQCASEVWGVLHGEVKGTDDIS
jgi:hypothetical protein